MLIGLGVSVALLALSVVMLCISVVSLHKRVRRVERGHLLVLLRLLNAKEEKGDAKNDD